MAVRLFQVARIGLSVIGVAWIALFPPRLGYGHWFAPIWQAGGAPIDGGEWIGRGGNMLAALILLWVVCRNGAEAGADEGA